MTVIDKDCPPIRPLCAPAASPSMRWLKAVTIADCATFLPQEVNDVHPETGPRVADSMLYNSAFTRPLRQLLFDFLPPQSPTGRASQTAFSCLPVISHLHISTPTFPTWPG